ncbi:NAD(+)/NADH kinase [Actinoplanes sp. NPDC051470]|uniref:NAD(+)/NADH kinase n=2 Tax=unclassified Actinoplanes TaxID=2626549 RepID=UPI0034290782
MDHEVETIGLVLHPRKAVGESVETILKWARRGEGRVLVREVDRDRVPAGVDVVSEAEFRRRVDGVVALGGDGTMLGAMRLVADRPVPVLGVNHGNLGFLVEVNPSGLEQALAQLAEGDFTVEQHGCLVAETSGPALTTGYGFNDVVLARLGRTGAVSIDLTVNDMRYGYYKCDAVVLATPNGSTAYNYAAGGPVLSPSAACTVITPVAPMAGIGRAVVLGVGDQVSLSVAADSAPVAVDVDGTAAGELQPGDTLTARLRVHAAEVVRLDAGAHAGRSRVKLSLLDLPLRRDQLLELIPAELRQEAAEINARRSGAGGPFG